MNDEIAQLRLQLDRLSDEFRASQLTIRKLEKRRIWRPNVVVLIGLIVATVLTINLWSAKAYSGSDPQAGGIAPSNPPTIFKAPFEIDDSAGKPIFTVPPPLRENAPTARTP